MTDGIPGFSLISLQSWAKDRPADEPGTVRMGRFTPALPYMAALLTYWIEWPELEKVGG